MSDYERILKKAMMELTIAKELGPAKGHAVLVQARYHLNLALEEAEQHERKRENLVGQAVAEP